MDKVENLKYSIFISNVIFFINFILYNNQINKFIQLYNYANMLIIYIIKFNLILIIIKFHSIKYIP